MHLSPRQAQVLAGLATGRGRDQVAHDIGISPHTMKTHLNDAMRRLGARNTLHAVALALSRGEIEPPAPRPH